MKSKEEIRKEVIKRRKEISTENRFQYSDRIAKSLFMQKEWINSKIIMAYADFNAEVATDHIILEALLCNKKVYMPKVSGDQMEFYHIYSLDELYPGNWGIREPIDLADEKFSSYEENVLMIVPGTAFDKSGNRIGYGKGYYDRFLDKNLSVYTIGIAFSCQVYDEIPYNEKDKKVNCLITENEVYFNKR